MTKRFGFTLAEVLITLGIIGVVAAMTMPTLINQTNGAQYRAAYKKALSAISQGVTLNVALDDISFADTDTASSASSTAGQKSIAGILMSRMNVVKTDETTTPYANFPTGMQATSCTLTTGESPNTVTKIVDCGTEGATKTNTNITTNMFLYFNDSSVFAFNKADTGCTQTSSIADKNHFCYGAIDVNGAKGPNKMVTCDGTTEGSNVGTGKTCEVKSPTDVYPVVYYDQTILPASDAGRAVLYGK